MTSVTAFPKLRLSTRIKEYPEYDVYGKNDGFLGTLTHDEATESYYFCPSQAFNFFLSEETIKYIADALIYFNTHLCLRKL